MRRAGMMIWSMPQPARYSPRPAAGPWAWLKSWGYKIVKLSRRDETAERRGGGEGMDTNKQLTAILEGLVADNSAVSKAGDAVRHGLTALRTDDRLKRRLTPEGQREQAHELRQATSER